MKLKETLLGAKAGSLGATACRVRGLGSLMGDRTILVLVVMFCAGMGGLLWHVAHLQSRLVNSISLQNASLYSQALAEFRTLYTSEVVKRVKSQGIEITHDYLEKEGAIPLPATLSMLLGNRIAENGTGGQTRLYSDYPFPWRKETGGLKDDFGREAWASLTQNPDKPFYRFQEFQGRPSLRYATADLMRASCISCHNTHPDTPKNNWKIDDVRGVLEVSVPLDGAMAQARVDLRGTFILMAVMTVLGLSGLILVIGRLRQTAIELEKRVEQRTAWITDANTELMELIVQREEAEKAYRDLYDYAPDGYQTVDENGVLQQLNETEAQMFGRKPEEMIGRTFSEFLTETSRAVFDAHLQCLQTQDKSACELECIAADGSLFPVALSATNRTRDEDRFTTRAILRDITQRKQAEQELEDLHKQLVDTSRQAGMAEIASGVLHNVGNVLNSVNVSATVVCKKVRKSKIASLAKATQLMCEHEHDLGTFLTEDEQGKQLPGYLTTLAEHLAGEQVAILDELGTLTTDIDHIKDIINTQQSHATAASVIESVSIADVVDDALRINATSFDRYNIELVRAYKNLHRVETDKQKLLQIMVNLVRNAKHALLDGRRDRHRQLTVRINLSEQDHVRIEVVDTGVGISQENLSRIFTHGFTTKKDGHGFGLHSAALAAKEMGGSLAVHSDGLDKGATFTLELPLHPTEVTP